jgi:transport and Golgi organization protein 2
VCTVSWVHQPAGYHLLVNRDEKLTRGRAIAPVEVMTGGIRYVAPVDPDFGGTWLAVNEFGMSLCLLNGDGGSAGSGTPARRSRGLVLRELAWVPSSAECVLWLWQLDLGRFAPFTLLVLEPDKSGIVAEWNGECLTLDPAGEAHMPLTSSSYDAEGVRRFRRDEFAHQVGLAGGVDPALLYRFHSSHGASPDAYSPCMHRGDAETVSFSWVVVTQRDIRFLYLPTAPCRSMPCKQKVLMRAA